MTSLTISSSDSYQSLSDLTIMCPLCIEEKNKQNSFMTECKHSWCFECNEQLNKNNINNCPLCKKKFNPFLTEGKWVTENRKLIWKRGILDSEKKVKWKNRQAYFYNLVYYSKIDIPVYTWAQYSV